MIGFAFDPQPPHYFSQMMSRDEKQISLLRRSAGKSFADFHNVWTAVTSFPFLQATHHAGAKAGKAYHQKHSASALKHIRLFVNQIWVGPDMYGALPNIY